MGQSSRTFVGLDIGTTKISCIVADQNGGGERRVAGIGTAPRAGLKVADLVLEPLASSHAVLGDDERDLGVVVLDLGGGTTDVAVFFEGSIRHTAIIPFGGANVTNDIAIGLRTPIDKAEQIKIQHGCALASLVSSSDLVTVPGVGGRTDREISRHVLASMIEPRME